MITTFQESTLFIKLISPYVLYSGAYGRINNIEAITQVCKSWQEWIYSDEGPFYLLDKDMRTNIRAIQPKCGSINFLNRSLYKAGKMAFKFVENYKAGNPLPQLSFKEPLSYVNPQNQTPLQQAIDLELEDNSKLDLIKHLILNGANLHQSVSDPSSYAWFAHWTKRTKTYCSYLVYIFRKNTLDINFRMQLGNLFLEYGHSLHFLGADGNAFLHHYCDFLDDDGIILNWYLEKGGNLNIKSQHGLTPVEHILHNPGNYTDYTKEASRLIRAGTLGHLPDPNGDYWLHLLVKKARVEFPQNPDDLASAILNRYPEQLYAKDAQGQTPLYIAVRKDSCVKNLLLEFAVQYYHVKPLAWQLNLVDAFFQGFKGILLDKWLSFKKCSFEPGQIHFELANPQLNFNDLEDLLIKIANKDQNRYLLLLIPDEAGNTFMHHLAFICPAIIDECFSFQQKLLFLQITNKKGETVLTLQQRGYNTQNLILAIHKGDVQSVSALLKQPVDLNFTDIAQNTMLHLAISRCVEDETKENIKYYKIIKLLLQQGFNPNAKNIEGHSPYFYAKHILHYPKVHLLLKDFGGKDD